MAILLTYFIQPSFLYFDYAYLVLGLISLCLFAYLVYKNPILLRKFILTAPFFIFLYLLFEITALYLGQWNFTGQYIGTVELVGGLRFPLEELVIGILLSSSVVLSYYKLYVDDEEQSILYENFHKTYTQLSRYSMKVVYNHIMSSLIFCYIRGEILFKVNKHFLRR